MEKSLGTTDIRKETYGVEVGDKITCHWEEENKAGTADIMRRATGIVYEVDYNHPYSKDVATFWFKNYRNHTIWFCGKPSKIVKP